LSGADSTSDDAARRIRHRQQTHALLHRSPLLLFAVAAVAGIIVDAAVGPTLQQAWGVSRVLALWVPAAIFAVVAALLKKSNRCVCLFLPMFPLAAAWHAVADANFEAASIRSILSQQPEPTVVIGVIDRPIALRRHPLADSPSRRDQSPWQSQFEFRLQQLRVGHAYEPIAGRLLAVSDGKLDQLLPGDQVEVFGNLRLFAAPTNPGEPDLRSVYRRRGLHGRIEAGGPDQIVRRRVSATNNINIHRVVASVAAGSRELLMRYTTEQNRGIALALVLGQREFVDQPTRDLLLVTGTAHLLSVSGLHLAIVVVLASWTGLLLGLPLPARVIWIITVCALYTAITGGRPPVMRASILVATFMISMWIGRQGQPINTLSLAALILLAVNPENVFSVGVQLSFLAVATLILCGRRSGSDSPAVQRALGREQRLHNLTEGALPKPLRYARWCGFYLGQAIWFSGCVTMISIPLVWYQFHVVSTVSVITNVVLAPCLFVSLAAGVATVVAGWCYEPLATMTGWVCDLGLSAMFGVIEFAAAIPGGHFWLPAPPAWWVAVFYLVLLVSLVWFGSPLAARLRRSWVIGWIGIAWWIATSPVPMDNCAVEATFVDVGHGTSVVLRFAEGDVWLYDCGRLGNDLGSSRDIDATLWSLGVTRLRGIFLSHADSDHYNALPGVLRRFGVAKILTPPGMLSKNEANLADARDAIKAQGIAVDEIAAGEQVHVAGAALHVLHPPAAGVRENDGALGSDNANSLVLVIGRGGVALILPGDLEPPGTALLVNQDRPPPGSVLMAPHHGSLTMDARSVLQWARPRETVVSGGRRARRPAVRKMLAITGSGVHVTAEVGAIRVRIDTDGRIDVRSWTESPW
jgi:competence protein ComEC